MKPVKKSILYSESIVSIENVYYINDMFYLMCLLVETYKNFKLWESSKDKIKMLLLKMYTVLIVKKMV